SRRDLHSFPTRRSSDLRKQAVMEGFKLLSRTLALSQELRAQINSTGVFRVLELDQLLPEEVRRDNILLDPTKVTVDISSCGYTRSEEHTSELQSLRHLV